MFLELRKLTAITYVNEIINTMKLDFVYASEWLETISGDP